MFDCHIDPVLCDNPGVVSLSSAHLVGGKLIPRDKFSTLLYVHSWFVYHGHWVHGLFWDFDFKISVLVIYFCECFQSVCPTPCILFAQFNPLIVICILVQHEAIVDAFLCKGLKGGKGYWKGYPNFCLAIITSKKGECLYFYIPPHILMESSWTPWRFSVDFTKTLSGVCGV